MKNGALQTDSPLKSRFEHADSLHASKILRISASLKNHKGAAPLSLKKKSVNHQVPKPRDKRYSDDKIDISDLNEILEIDAENKTCTAEPGVTFIDLVNATLEYGLVPLTVPEQKTITIGGAVAGCSIESMSFMYGGFHDSCLEYEVISAKGEVLSCAPGKDNELIFQMMNGTFGTLGIISKLKFKLVAAKSFVKVTNEKYGSIEDYKTAIWRHYKDRDYDFMDGLIYSSSECVLCMGSFVDEAPYVHNYDWMRIYYEMAKNDKEDYLKTADYFFRYDKGTTHVDVKSRLGRFLFGKFLGSTNVLMAATLFHKLISAETIPVVIDVFVPFSKLRDFLEWHERETHYFPLWCVPYKVVRPYEWISDDYFTTMREELLIDIAIYSMKTDDNELYYRKLEKKMMELGGLKTLISNNYYTEDEFWRTWNKRNYDAVKRITDPDNIFRDLYEKTVKAALGLGK
jgi:FAD/FMN-containing dehydrogenase